MDELLDDLIMTKMIKWMKNVTNREVWHKMWRKLKPTKKEKTFNMVII